MQTDRQNCRLWPDTALNMACRALLAVVLLSVGSAQAAMYRWVDSNGRVHYSDTLPPTYQKSGAAEMSKQGNVIRRTQSEAERQAEAERRAEQRRIQQERDKQAQLDRALTQTYTTVAEIDLARDRALEHHRLAIKGAQARAKAVDANMAELRSRVASIKKAGRPVAPNLMDRLNQSSRESLELRRIILNNEEAMVRVSETYEANKARFRELTGK